MVAAVVVITGASSGVGAATAQELARRGARLVLAARGASALEETAERCRELGAEVVAVPVDVTDPVAIEELADEAVRAFGRLDVWVNNAAVAAFGELTVVPLVEVRRLLDTNVMGYLHGARAAIPRMRAGGGGVIVMVGSVLSEVTFPYVGAYALTKHAVLAMCGTLRQELKPADGITVCAVHPVSVNTPLWGTAANHTGHRIRPPRPVTSPRVVARRIARLIEGPRRQTPAGFGGRLTQWQRRLWPGLTEKVLGFYGRHTLRAVDPRPPTAGNLFRPSAHVMPPTIKELDMSRTERTISAPLERVFAVLADGWTYSDWVVGTAHIQAVDPDWPSAGSALYPNVGPWPVSVRGKTQSLECDPPHRLVMRPKLWPAGELTVSITLHEVPGGTRVVLEEQITGGPVVALRNKVNDLLLHSRNQEVLRRLADLVHRRGSAPQPPLDR